MIYQVRRIFRLLAALVALATAGGVLLGCSSASGGGQVVPVGHFGVGVLTERWLDSTRPTPAYGSARARKGRLIVTTVLYPSTSAPLGKVVPGAAPDTGDGPYPLIAFAPGYGSDPQSYEGILSDWASAGYVVAALLFPLTSTASLSGLDLGDYVHQPADMSFVISKVLRASSAGNGALGGMVDPGRIGAAGHSLGGVTVLGLVANTCCRDSRVRAAVVMSGDAISFPTGRVDYSAAPPLLLVHGDADPTVPYVSSVDSFNQASPPKGLLTIEGGDHSSPVLPGGVAFDNVVNATTDLFDRYLKGSRPALSRLKVDAASAHTRLVFAASASENVTVPTPPTTPTHLNATVTPASGVADGQFVTVSWEGYAPGVALDIVECSKNPPSGATDCDLSNAKLFQPDPLGAGSVLFALHTGSVGTGTCDANHPGCVVVVDQGGSSAPSDSVTVPISFGT